MIYRLDLVLLSRELLSLYPGLHILQKRLFKFIRPKYLNVRYPGLEDIADGFIMTHPERNDKRSVRFFFFYLLGGEHPPPFEIMTDLGIDQDRDLQFHLIGKPDIATPVHFDVDVSWSFPAAYL